MNKNSLLTKAYRTLYLLAYIAIGLLVVLFSFSWISTLRKRQLIQWWSQHITRAFNLDIQVHGMIPGNKQQHVLFVANHVSWVDIFAINSIIPLRFIAKSEIKSWPIIGYLATKANTLFIQREKKQQANLMNLSIAQSLSQGDNLCLFPEGTTTHGDNVYPFKASLFQAAIDANTVVWPIAIRYIDHHGKIDSEMAYADEISLLASFNKVISQPKPRVILHFLTPISANKVSDRQMLSFAAREAIVECLEQH